MRARLVGRPLLTVLAVLLLGLVPRLSEAQAGPRLTPGDRVRVSHTDSCCRSPQTGRLVSLSLDSLVLDTLRGSSTAPLVLPRDRVRTVEYGRDAGSYALRGAVIGLLAGVVTTGVTLGVMSRGCEDICARRSSLPLSCPQVLPSAASSAA